MIYDCELICDIVSLYIDEALSEKSRLIVDAHLAECETCRNYYQRYVEQNTAEPVVDTGTKMALDLAVKARKYRMYQVVMFAVAALSFCTFGLSWFGYTGITEISGFVIFHHPLAMIGIILFTVAIWYHFRHAGRRLMMGGVGISAIILIEIWAFFTIRTGSTAGFQIGPFHYDIPIVADIDFAESLRYTLPGFYIAFVGTLLTAVLFVLFVRQTKRLGEG